MGQMNDVQEYTTLYYPEPLEFSLDPISTDLPVKFRKLTLTPRHKIQLLELRDQAFAEAYIPPLILIPSSWFTEDWINDESSCPRSPFQFSDFQVYIIHHSKLREATWVQSVDKP